MATYIVYETTYSTFYDDQENRLVKRVPGPNAGPRWHDNRWVEYVEAWYDELAETAYFTLVEDTDFERLMQTSRVLNVGVSDEAE